MVDPVDVTLGEVWRNLQELKALVRDSLIEIKTDVDIHVEAKTAALKVRMDRIEKLVYGTFALLGANLVAVIAHMFTEMK